MSAQIIDFNAAIPPRVLQARHHNAQNAARAAFRAAVDRLQSGETSGDEACEEIAHATAAMVRTGCLTRD